MKRTSFTRGVLVGLYGLSLVAGARAGAWAEIGDGGLRSDILMLSSAGVLDELTMQWPLPWASILKQLDRPQALEGQSSTIRAAAERVRRRATAENRTHTSERSANLDIASDPALIRGFDAMGYGTVQGQANFAYRWDTTAFRLSLGGKTAFGKDRQALTLDGSYLAQDIGPVELYAGYTSHWWGPGWISALSLSNNARPMPQIGITRTQNDAFESPWLSWLGPWRAEFMVGWMDGRRTANDTLYTAFRFAFHPTSHLEIGFARTTEMCGTGHSCSPWSDYFNIDNSEKHTNNSNDQGNIDIRYSGTVSGLPFETYVQFMNEDTNPLQHSDSSHLYGASLWLPMGENTLRLTTEYADSVATHDLWGSGTMPGRAYNNWLYADGMHYRGRSLGFSLDSDSRLLTLQASYVTDQDGAYTLSFHHAEISTPLNAFGNVVTKAPVIVNMIEGRTSLPLPVGEGVTFDLSGRVQDDQPRPLHGWRASIEAALTVHL